VLTELWNCNISLEVLASADLGMMSGLKHKECQSSASGIFFADNLQSHSNKGEADSGETLK
jgi:hypothetical protein